MVAFLSFVIFALVGIVVASPLELKTKSNWEKRDWVVDCPDSGKADFISAAFSEAKNLANMAANWMGDYGVYDPVFLDYFGAGQNNYTIQQAKFMDMLDFTALLSCNDPLGECQNAGPDYSTLQGIYFCSDFFNQLDSTHLCSGPNIDVLTTRGGTLLNQVILAETTGIEDSYGDCSQARLIASVDPYTAAYNPDSYSCFAMQVYADTMCPSPV